MKRYFKRHSVDIHRETGPALLFLKAFFPLSGNRGVLVRLLWHLLLLQEARSSYQPTAIFRALKSQFEPLLAGIFLNTCGVSPCLSLAQVAICKIRKSASCFTAVL